MRYQNIFRGLIATTVLSTTTTLNAQTIPVVEDFSSPTALWQIRIWGDDAAPAGTGYSINDDHIELRVVGDEADPHRGIEIVSPYNTDSGVKTVFGAEVQAMANSTIGETGELRTRIVHHFYNALSDGGFPDRDDDSQNEGDVSADLRMKFGQNFSNAAVCMHIKNSLGEREDLLIFDDGQDNCHRFELEPVLGETYRMVMSFDPGTGLMTASVGDESFDFQLPHTTFYEPADNRPDVEVTSDGVDDVSILRVYGIGSDTFLDDYKVDGPPALTTSDDWIIRGSGGIRPIIENGRLKMVADSTDGESEQSRLNVRGETDYLQADMILSSETQYLPLNEDAKAMVRLSGNQYDVYADGGIDGSDIGGVWARIEMLMRPDRTTYSRYCLERFDTGAPDYLSTDLLADGKCSSFDLTPELDQSYTAVISTDRVARTVTFKLGDEVFVHNIAEPEIFLEGFDREYSAVRSRIENGIGTVVGYADNVRTVSVSDDFQMLDDSANDVCESADSDTDGDGWGWENEMSCIVDNANAQQNDDAIVMSNPMTRIQNVCASAESDIDRDGWGWENGTSCVVNNSTAQQEFAVDIPPFCTSEAVAVDPQGWGWENDKTCIVEGTRAHELAR